MKFALLLVILFMADGYMQTSSPRSEPSEDEPRRQITIYNTYGYLDGNEWVIPTRVWVNKKRRWMQGFVTWMLDLTSDYSDEQINIFRSRLRDIVADSKSRRTVTFRLPGDPDEHIFRVMDSKGEFPRTDRNGLILGELRIPVDLVNRIFEENNRTDGWIELEATSGRYVGSNHIQLIPPEGLSVISDIDDTVKITEIPAGGRIVVRNTFFKEYSAAPIMADMYAQWEDAAFHYVSGSPWQLFNPLGDFLFGEKAGFPVGSLHMKSARKNPLTISSWRDLLEFITNENLTFEQKIDQISTIFEHFPDRQFIMVGDSGERDPEVYGTIRERYPDQVKRIYIRDVINDRELNPDRLAGMEIIPAPTIYRPGQITEEDILDEYSYSE
ncbi:MAG: DUF2183 domain-containing protein [Balneolaceae bacterium]|nr:DUF2183 domain-containing protein [Balneolaceae bacterium]